ncbi:MAG: DNA repair exonuclease [Dehalococcoidia bacterium]|nr:DNA repair exonuclease [Dehalococcoidia bacterium]
MDHLRFLHAADLHLDSPFAGLRATAPEAIRERLISATFDAYNALIALALAERVDAVLIAGDVYDSADRSLRAQLAFVRGLERLAEAGIRSFVCHGNHDPLDGWDARLPLPPLAHRFGKDVEGIPLDPSDPARATVYGVSYPTRRVLANLVPRFARSDSSRFAIGLLHANAGTNTGHEPYAPCTLDDLVRSGIDYWALGHVHTHAILHASNPTVVYPGNLQGRHPNETGPRGAVLVSVDAAGRCNVDFRPLDVVRWQQIDIPLDSAADVSAAMSLIHRSVGAALEGAAGRSLVLRLNLVGRSAVREDLLHRAALDDLEAEINNEWAAQQPFAWCERITHRLRPEFDREAALEAGDFLAELLAVVDTLRQDPHGPSELRTILEPFYTRAGSALRPFVPDDAAMLRLLGDAEAECVDRLQEMSR